MSWANHFPKFLIGVPFTVNQDRFAGDLEGGIEVVQGHTGRVVGFKEDAGLRTRRIDYLKVSMDNGTTGFVDRDVLEIGTGWPFVAREDWRPDPYRNWDVSVRPGDHGNILGYTDNLKWVTVIVTNHLNPDSRAHSGQIPSHIIAFGNERKFGDIFTINRVAADAFGGVHDRPMFTMYEAPNRYLYRRRLFPCIEKDQEGVGPAVAVGYFGTRNPVWFYMTFDIAPPIATMIHLTFEVTIDGSRHPKAWALLPTVCRYRDAARACTLGIQARYYDKSKKSWMLKYLQTAHFPRRFNDNFPGSIMAIGEAIGMLNSLEQVSFRQEEARVFDRIFPLSNVVKVSFDPLRQIQTIEGSSSKKRTPVWITPRGPHTDSFIHKRLEAAGATMIRSPWRRLPGSVLQSACDRCYLAGTSGDDGRNLAVAYSAEYTPELCKALPGTDQCLLCYVYDMPCSWTHSSERNRNLINALWFPMADPTAPLEIPDPEIILEVYQIPSSV